MSVPVEIGGLRLRNPVLVAAGCGGTGRELAPYTPLDRLGAFVTRSLTLDPRPGGPTPRVVESASGLVHSTGCPNPGLEIFLATELPPLLQAGAKVVVSVTGADAAEIAELAARLGRAPGVAALEVGLGAPDAAAHGLLEVRSAAEAAGLIAAVADALPPGVPVLAKVPLLGGAHLPPPAVLAEALAPAGAAGLVLGQPLPALLPDGRAAGLSGPALLPVTLRAVAEVAARTRLPVIAAGGVRTPADLAALLAAGASAVAVGTAVLHDPTTPGRLVEALDLAPSGPSQPEEPA